MTAAAIRAGRRRAELLMVDTCTITRPGEGSGPMDEGTLQHADPEPTFIYDGKCRLQVRGVGSSTTPEAGGRDWVVQETILQLPVAGSEEVRIGDMLELVDSNNDPSREGRRFHIARRLSDKTHATKREFLLTEAG